MKKKLTINRLAIGNLKARKKQYFTMILGIILAMVFSSSIIFFMFSATETSRVQAENRVGYQDAIIACEDFSKSDYDKLIKKKWISSYSCAHIIGRAYSGREDVFNNVGWLEDSAKEMSNQSFIEGRYPTAENEVAIEHSALLSLGIPRAKIGDTITLKFRAQNGINVVASDPVEKEYILVGIVSDKASYMKYYYYAEDSESFVPSIFVAQDTVVDDGGKEILSAYVKYTDYIEAEAKRLTEQSNGQRWYDSDELLQEYIRDETGGKFGFNGARAFSRGGLMNFDQLFSGGDVLVLVIFVMIFAACVAIVNAFNSNLKDRKTQIGLMRAVGATKRQIIKIYGRETFIISLIVTPLSVLISYFVVKITLKIIAEDAVMSKSLVALPIAALVNIIVVMFASFIPLKIASRITPMQAIRNTSNNRKAKIKKIKSKKQFKASNLWAKRSLSFYKGSHIAVSFILAGTVFFTCVSASAISYSKNNMRSLPYDFVLSCYSDYINYIVNETGKGYTQSDYQQVLSKPYVLEVSGTKAIGANLIVDDYDDFLYSYNADDVVYRVTEYQGVKNIKDFKTSLEEGIRKRVLFEKSDGINDTYYAFKNAIGLEDNKELYNFHLTAIDDKALSDLEKCISDGRLDLKKLASGEEVIMIAPQKREVAIRVYKTGGMGLIDLEDDDIGKKNIGYKTAMTAECPYKVGDTIEIVTAVGSSGYDEVNQCDTFDFKKINRRKVKIGAIIKPNELRKIPGSPIYSNFGIVTNLQGLNNFCQGVTYNEIRVKSAVEVNDENNAEFMDDLKYFVGNDDERGLSSNYENIKWEKDRAQTLMVAMISVTIIGFAICVSIINNALTSRIRESKRVIGMLRTVGADRVALVKSFILQMLSMFGWGVGIGYAVYILVYIGSRIAEKILRYNDVQLNFSPWFAIVMTVIMFAVCSINLWSKIRKEMKNSIIENIREL